MTSLKNLPPPGSEDADDEARLVAQARGGSREAFDRLVRDHVPALRAFALRMVMQPQDAEDLAQDTLLQAHERLASFRGDARFRTWLFAILTRRCIDHLRTRRRWPTAAQTRASNEHKDSPELMADLRDAAAGDPGFTYEYREHVAYCFACIGRSLEPEDAAALLLRDVFDLTNQEAAQACGMNLASLRHRLASARAQMTATFDGLCALVGKGGACWQCAELRDALPEHRRGAPVAPVSDGAAPPEQRLARRLAIVRDAALGTGREPTRALHEYIIRYMARAFD